MAKNNDKKLEEIVSYLQSKTERNKKAAKNTWIVGGLLILFVAGYLTWVVGSLRSIILNPTELADAVVGNVDEAVPAYIDETKVYLKSQAPKLAANVKDQIMELFPQVRVHGEEGIEAAYEKIPALRSEIEGAIEAHFEAHGDDIKAFYEAHDDDTEAAKYVVDGVVASFLATFDDQLKETTGTDGLFDVKVASLKSLRDINKQLINFVKKGPYQLTREERMQRRVIVTWLRALDGHFKDEQIQLSFNASAK